MLLVSYFFLSRTSILCLIYLFVTRNVDEKGLLIVMTLMMIKRWWKCKESSESVLTRSTEKGGAAVWTLKRQSKVSYTILQRKGSYPEERKVLKHIWGLLCTLRKTIWKVSNSCQAYVYFLCPSSIFFRVLFLFKRELYFLRIYFCFVRYLHPLC